jgi:hypothetical protein
LLLWDFLGLNHLPLKDFRAYKWNNIQRKEWKFNPESVVEMVFIYDVAEVKKTNLKKI